MRKKAKNSIENLIKIAKNPIENRIKIAKNSIIPVDKMYYITKSFK